MKVRPFQSQIITGRGRNGAAVERVWQWECGLVPSSVKPNVDFDRGEGMMWTSNIKYPFHNFRRGGVATKWKYI